MKSIHIVLLTIAAAGLAAAGPGVGQQRATPSASAAPLPSGGMLRTMPQGDYQCALPGDAGGDAFEVVTSEGFSIAIASRYTDADGRGTYVLRGKQLTFTAGPKSGQRFERVGQNQLRKLSADGSKSDLLCTRLSRTN